MVYKGHFGSVHYNEKDGIYQGKFKGADALISYEGQTLEELEQAFRKAVDDCVTDESAGQPDPRSDAGEAVPDA